MNKKLLIIVGTSAGLSLVSAKAEFTGYYALDNVGPGGYQSIAVPGGAHPISQGNWALDSNMKSLVEFQRAPGLSSEVARSFTLTVNFNNTGDTGVGMLEIIQPIFPNPFPLADAYTFTYNAGLPTAGNSFWYIDYDGVPKPLVGQGTATFVATPGSGGDKWGFYVSVGSTISVGSLQIQDWQQVPEPSSIAMITLAGLGIVGYGIRKYRATKA